MTLSEPRKSRLLLLGWIVAVFLISAVTNPYLLLATGLAALLIFRRGAIRAGRKVLISVVPITVTLSLASWIWLRWLATAPGNASSIRPFVTLGLRTTLIAFLSFAVLQRVELFSALAPWPTLSRLLAITLAQIHALRLLATESLLGLRSRLLHKPSVVDVVRGAGGITGSLFTLSTRNARDIADAMRSRGF